MRRIGAAVFSFSQLFLFSDRRSRPATGRSRRGSSCGPTTATAKRRSSRSSFPFPPSQLPVGQTVGFEETVDAGTHAELSVAQIKLDLGYGNWFLAHTQLHATG